MNQAQTEEVSVPIWVIGVVAGVVGLIVLIALFVVTFVCGWYASKKCSRTRRPTRALRKDPKLIVTEEVDNPGFHMSPVPSPTMSDIATSTTSVKNNGECCVLHDICILIGLLCHIGINLL